MEVRAGETIDVDTHSELSVSKQDEVIPSLKLNGKEVLEV